LEIAYSGRPASREELPLSQKPQNSEGGGGKSRVTKSSARKEGKFRNEKIRNVDVERIAITSTFIGRRREGMWAQLSNGNTLVGEGPAERSRRFQGNGESPG